MGKQGEVHVRGRTLCDGSRAIEFMPSVFGGLIGTYVMRRLPKNAGHELRTLPSASIAMVDLRSIEVSYAQVSGDISS